jgi:acyl-CoA synthetase (AMP-forming)/AMP-acid ligase II
MYQDMRDDNSMSFLSHLKLWICSGEVLPVQLAKEFFNRFGDGKHILCNFYGSTEIMGDVTYFTLNSKKQAESFKKIPIGYPIFNTTIYILDESCQQVENGKIEEIFVSGSNLALGYVNGRDSDRFIKNTFSDESGKFFRLKRIWKNSSIISRFRTFTSLSNRRFWIDPGWNFVL